MATENQDIVVKALRKLGLETEGLGMPGVPIKVKVTEGTVDQVKKFVGKTFVVDTDGSVSEE
jgi:hypothetical protein